VNCHVAVLSENAAGAGSTLAATLRTAGYQASVVEASPDIAATLTQLGPDRVLNALTGGVGRGMVQGVLDLLDLPYSQSGLLASALAAHRHQAKILFKSANIPVTDHVIADRAEVGRSHVMEPPYVIKPLLLGTGAGTLLVRAGSAVPPPEILAETWALGEEVMVERHIPGRHLACSVMGDVALGVAEIVVEPAANTGGDPAKSGSVHIFSAQVQPKIYDKVQKLSLAAHAALGCRGVTRIDFRFNDAAGPDGELVCLQIDTQPDMAETSLVSAQAMQAGHSYQELVTWMVEDARCNR
jgi:D-alanine-D-alanine ligase